MIKIMENEQLYLKGLGDIDAEETKILNIKAKCCVKNKKNVTKKLEEWIIKEMEVRKNGEKSMCVFSRWI